jgi:hypothetical protein
MVNLHALPAKRTGVIEKVFYPVFPPNESAATTIRWLQEHLEP